MAENENVAGFVLNADLSEFRKQMEEYNVRLGNMEKVTAQTTTTVGDMFSKMGKAAGAYFSASTLKSFVNQIIQVRGQFQQLEIAFGTMLGSQERANALMKQLTDTASKTPFDLQSIAQGAKQLLAYGTASEEVNETLVRLGNIASGLSIPLNDLVYLYGTTQTQGRLFTQDVRQFMGRGIPLVKELSKQLGKSEEEINNMVTAGKIGFPEVKKVIESMTNEGGQFFQLMEKQSASLTGQISNLDDAIDVMFNEIGQSTQEYLSKGIQMTSALVENYKTVGKVIATLVEVYGAYKAALLVTMAIEKAEMIQREGLVSVIKRQIIVQKALNAVTKLNPYVAIAAAVVGIAAVILTWKENTDALTSAQQRLNDTISKGKEKIDEEIEQAKRDIQAIQDKTASITKQREAYERLQKVKAFEGKSKDEIASMKYDEANRILQQHELEQTKKIADDQVKSAEERLKAAQQLVELGRMSMANDQGAAYYGALEQRRQAEADIVVAKKNQTEEARKLKEMQKDLDLLVLEGAEKIAKVEEWNKKLNEQILELKRQQSEVDEGDFDSNKTIALLKSRIRLLEEEKRANDKRIEGVKDSEKKLVKDYEYWEGAKKEATEAFHRALPGTKAFNEAKKNIQSAEEQMKKWEIQTAKAKDAISELKNKLADMEAQIQLARDKDGKGSFEQQRLDLKSEYEQKLRDLERQKIKDIETSYGDAEILKKIDEDYKALADNAAKALKVALENVSEEESEFISRLDKETINFFRKDLERTLAEIDDEAERLIKEAGEKLGKNTNAFLEAKGNIEKNRNDKKQSATVQSLINASNAQLEIERRRIRIEEDITDENERQKKILDAEYVAYENQVVMLENKADLTEEENMQLEDLLLKLQENEKEYQNILQTAQQIKRENLAGMFQRIGNSFGWSSNSVMSGIGSIFGSASAIYSQYSNKRNGQQIDKSEAISSAVASTVEFAMDAFSKIASAAEANKKALEAWDLAVAQSAHNAALNRIDALSYQNRSIFGLDNPFEQIASSSMKMSQTNIEMLAEIERLRSEGQVKTGTRKAVDWKSSLELMGSGAAAGAAIGAAAGGGVFSWLTTLVGTAIGAVTGLVTGIAATRKEIDVFKSLQSQYGDIIDYETKEINPRILEDYDKLDEHTRLLVDQYQELSSKWAEARDEMEGFLKEMVGDMGTSLQGALVNAFAGGDVFDAIDAFHDYTTQKLGDILQSVIFNTVFGNYFSTLSDQLQNAMGDLSGNNQANIVTALTKAERDVERMFGQYNSLMQTTKDIFEKQGFYMWEETENAKAEQDALRETIASMSEATADELNGNFMGLKLTAIEINFQIGNVANIAQQSHELMSRSLEAMNRVADNTAYCARLERLEEIASDIRMMRIEGIEMR